ncbi:hypothetical protein HLH17_14950 [Acinetobacter sp. ANC 5380]|uniref:Spermidine synthase n=1 Tax=Acinetobacter terrae TaxID=2731247 RepID=A0A7Y2WC36_9GAMM|nr:hypothetical protein [Acinetobacter terrae]NNH78919.1 hypothetical protein [Acinetobacter terrae]
MLAKNTFKYGQVQVKPSKFGEWQIIEFEISDSDASFFNMRNAINGRSHLNVEAGSYTRLMKANEVVMSNTQMELQSNSVAYENATGNVLIAGLGMGMILDAILSKPDVKSVLVVEFDQHIVDHIGAYYKDDSRVEIIQGSIFDYQLTDNEHYDYIWFDIWTFLSQDNCEEFITLYEKFEDHCDWMSFWGLEYFYEEYFEDCGKVLI